MRPIVLLIVIALISFGCDSDPEESAATEEQEMEVVAEEEADQADDADDDHYGDEDEHELAEDLEPGESRHYGEPFQDDDEPVTLAETVAQLEESDEEELGSVKVSTRIEFVCERRGCWASLDDDAVELPVRVRMKDYSFFLPRNVGGAEAIIEGSLTQVTTSEEDAKHYAAHITEQTGEEPDEIEGDQETYEFIATGVYVSTSDS